MTDLLKLAEKYNWKHGNHCGCSRTSNAVLCSSGLHNMQILNAIGEGFREGVEQEEQLRADWNVVIEDLERKLKETERDRDRYLKALSQETVKEMIEMAKKGYDH